MLNGFNSSALYESNTLNSTSLAGYRGVAAITSLDCELLWMAHSGQTLSDDSTILNLNSRPINPPSAHAISGSNKFSKG
jgi:hypothetical protein